LVSTILEADMRDLEEEKIERKQVGGGEDLRRTPRRSMTVSSRNCMTAYLVLLAPESTTISRVDWRLTAFTVVFHAPVLVQKALQGSC
jgi:hypothetical protein